MEKVKIGVLGAFRGRTMIDYCKNDKRVRLVAVCDFRKELLDDLKKDLNDDSVLFFENFDDMM